METTNHRTRKVMAALVVATLHRVVDVDQADGTRFQPDSSGRLDSDGDHLDDDGRVGITVGGASVCIVMGADDSTHAERGRC